MLSLLALLAVTPVSPPAKLPLATVVEKMQKNYDQAKDYRARFSQKYTNVAFNRTKVSSGEVAFKKGGRMRWDYDKPDPQMFVSDGVVTSKVSLFAPRLPTMTLLLSDVV